MRKCFVSRDLKRQHCLSDELCVIPCRLLFCYYVWTQFCMCRTKVKPHFRSKYVGRFLIHSTEETAMVKWLRKFFLATRTKKTARKMEEKEYELIRLLSVELLWVHCLQWKKNIWSLVKGDGGGMALNSLCLLKRVSTTVCNLFSWAHITFIVRNLFRSGRLHVTHFHSYDVPSNRIEP